MGGCNVSVGHGRPSLAMFLAYKAAMLIEVGGKIDKEGLELGGISTYWFPRWGQKIDNLRAP